MMIQIRKKFNNLYNSISEKIDIETEEDILVTKKETFFKKFKQLLDLCFIKPLNDEGELDIDLDINRNLYNIKIKYYSYEYYRIVHKGFSSKNLQPIINEILELDYNSASDKKVLIALNTVIDLIDYTSSNPIKKHSDYDYMIKRVLYGLSLFEEMKNKT